MKQTHNTVFEDTLRALHNRGKKIRICVIGAGHGGLPMVGHLPDSVLNI